MMTPSRSRYNNQEVDMVGMSRNCVESIVNSMGALTDSHPHADVCVSARNGQEVKG